MFRLTCAALVIGTAAAAVAAPGRVVRIQHAVAVVAPRLCVLRAEAGVCLGPAPAVGDAIRLVSLAGDGGNGVVESVSSLGDGCPSAWRVTASLHGELTQTTIGVIDPYRRYDHARVIPLRDPSTLLPPIDDGHVWYALDRDGDDVPDLVAVRAPCGGPAPCIDVWVRAHDRFTRVTRTAIGQCHP